jgi:hypothetical protein
MDSNSRSWGDPKALGHTRALQWLGLDIARPVVPDQEIVRASAHPAGPVEEQNSGHTLIVHRGESSVTAWRADMTDVMRSTVSPAYSAVWSTADSGPDRWGNGENIGRRGVCIFKTDMIARSPSLASAPLPALISPGASLTRPSS